MAMNYKHKCQCGALIIWKQNEIGPTHCHFCKTAIVGYAPEAKPTVAIKKLRSIYSGKTAAELKGQTTHQLGHGVDRSVYALSDTEVLKIGKKEANRAEVLRWQTAPDNIKPFLAPIIDWDEKDYAWVVMARAYNIGAPMLWDFPQALLRNIDDPHGGNIGMINNKPVVIDYVGGGVEWCGVHGWR